MRAKLFFDGELAEVIERFAGFKVVTVELADGARSLGNGLDRLGEVLEASDGRIKMKVTRDRVTLACKALLSGCP